MRYLTRQFAIGALRRGHGIEQFLRGTQICGEAAIEWVAISPMDGQHRVSLHTVQDPDLRSALEDRYSPRILGLSW